MCSLSAFSCVGSLAGEQMHALDSARQTALLAVILVVSVCVWKAVINSRWKMCPWLEFLRIVLVKYLHIWMNNTCAYNMLKYCAEQTMIHSLLILLFLNRMIHINTSLEEYTLFLFVTETRLQDPTKLLRFSQKKPPGCFYC